MEINYKHQIGECIKDNDKGFIVLDREVRKTEQTFKKNNKTYVMNIKWYKIKCLNCGLDNYCANKTVVQGINDIATTDPWMIPYFQGGENEAKLYSVGSGKRIIPICPDCGALLKESCIYNIHKHKVSCVCKNKISIPNKFAYYVFNQLDELDFYEREYSPIWANKYKYDNYFELNKIKYVVEMDGGLGHGKKTFRNNKDVNGLKRDIIKNELARKHNIKLIRIDCDCDFDQMIENFTSQISQIIKLNKINFLEIKKKCYENLTKNICLYYESNKNSNLEDIGKIFRLNKVTIRKYLKIGNNFGWCHYETNVDTKIKNINLVATIKNDNPEYSTSKISELTGFKQDTIRGYLKEAVKKNLCKYDPKEEMVRVHLKK